MAFINSSSKPFAHEGEYAFFLSFSAFVSVPFFLGIYMSLLRTAWLSILIGGLFSWFFLSLLIKTRCLKSPRPILSRAFALFSFMYGGIALYAFFVFCQVCIFPQHSFLFFPICFLIVTAYGACQGIHTLKRTAKFTTCTVIFLLFLTLISMLQKLLSQREFLGQSVGELFFFDMTAFIRQTLFLTAMLILQVLTLILITGNQKNADSFLFSIRRGLFWGVFCSALLYLVAGIALGAHSFERLLYPIYDMLSLPGYAEYLDRTELLMLIIFLFCESVKTICVFLAGQKVFFSQKKSTSPE